MLRKLRLKQKKNDFLIKKTFIFHQATLFVLNNSYRDNGEIG